MLNVSQHNVTASFIFLEVGLGPVEQVVLFFCICLIIVAGFKTLWHATFFARYVPESILIMVLGLAFGGVLRAIGFELPDGESFSEVFFAILLPLILFPEAYFANPVHIFTGLELVVVILHAVLGTLINTLLTGALIYSAVPLIGGLKISLIQCFMFGSLISATDPVSVMAVLEEIKADYKLQYLVGGESALNDAVGITLFQFFRQLVEGMRFFFSFSSSVLIFKPTAEPALQTTPINELVGLAFGQFFVIFLGGIAWGLCIGLIAATISGYTGIVANHEPLLVLAWALLASTLAEWFAMSGNFVLCSFVCSLYVLLFFRLFSLTWFVISPVCLGIIALMTCCVVMKIWVDKNMREPSRVATRSVLNLGGILADLIVFIFVGVVSLYFFLEHDIWNGALIGLVILFLLATRFFTTFLLNTLFNVFANWSDRISVKISLVQAWSGLRGPVAFALALSIPDLVAARSELITTTIAVVWGSFVVIGISIRPLLYILGIPKSAFQIFFCFSLFLFCNLFLRSQRNCSANGTPPQNSCQMAE